MKKNGIEFQDTGYRSLRQAVYSLPIEKKRSLIDILNVSLARGIQVQKRTEKAKKKLNIVASTATTIGIGAKIGADAATAINGVDPGLLAGVLNGTFLGAWIEKTTQKEWFTTLSAALGFIGTELLEKLPIVGGIAQKAFATENIAALTSIGATGGLVTGLTLSLASGIKQIYNYTKNKQTNEKFLKLDYEKYKDEDKKELDLIKENLNKPRNDFELIIIDIVVGYLKDENISLDYTPKSIKALNNAIKNLPLKEKIKAKLILANVEKNINDPTFVEQIKKAGKITVGLFTAGMATLSVYDIIRHGTFLPELSKKIFPENNIYNPVSIPDGPNKALDSETTEYKDAASLEDKFNNGTYVDEITYEEEYFIHENTGENNLMDTAKEVYDAGKKNKKESILSWIIRQFRMLGEQEIAGYYALGDGALDAISNEIGIEIVHELVPNKTAISNELQKLTPEKLLFFMRYMNNANIENNNMNIAIKEILSSPEYMNKVTDYIQTFVTEQRNHDFVIDITRKFANCAIPFSVFAEALGLVQKKSTNDEFGIEETEIRKK